MEPYEGYAVAHALGLSIEEWAQRLNLPTMTVTGWLDTAAAPLSDVLQKNIQVILEEELKTRSLYQALLRVFFVPIGFIDDTDPDGEEALGKLKDGHLSIVISDDGINLCDDYATRQLDGIYELHEAGIVAQKLSTILKSTDDPRAMVKQWQEAQGTLTKD